MVSQMKIYKVSVTLLVEGETPQVALDNALNELEYVMETDATICGFTRPTKAIFYKDMEEVTAKAMFYKDIEEVTE